MTWWNLFGMNPKLKDFMGKYPEMTVIGFGWAFYWRIMVLILVVEAIFFIPFLLADLRHNSHS